VSSTRTPAVAALAADADLCEVRRIVLAGLRDLGVRVFLFGSRARGDARATSDIDVALLSARPIPRGTLAAIREALEESRVPFRVDLVDLAAAGAELREHALREGIEWTASASA
jgi:hypothetical protein